MLPDIAILLKILGFSLSARGFFSIWRKPESKYLLGFLTTGRRWDKESKRASKPVGAKRGLFSMSFPLLRITFPLLRISFPLPRITFPLLRITFLLIRITFLFRRITFLFLLPTYRSIMGALTYGFIEWRRSIQYFKNVKFVCAALLDKELVCILLY